MTNVTALLHGGNSAAGQISIQSGATLIVPARAKRRAVILMQHGTTAVYIGASDVTSTTGLLLIGIAGTGISIPTDGALYGATGGAAQTLSYMEIF